MTVRWWQWPTNQQQSGASPKVVPTITARGSCWTPVPCLLDRRLYFVISLAHLPQPITAHCCWTAVSPLSSDRRLYFLQQPITAPAAVGLSLVPCLKGRRLFLSTSDQSQHLLLLDCHTSPLSSLTGDCFDYVPITPWCCWTFSPLSLFTGDCFFFIVCCFSTLSEVNIHMELHSCCK